MLLQIKFDKLYLLKCKEYSSKCWKFFNQEICVKSILKKLLF